MAGTSEEPRIYGEADPENHQPTPEQGYRGEQGAAKPLRTDLAHNVATPAGSVIEVQEQSGVAFAEATAKADGKDHEAPAAPSAD